MAIIHTEGFDYYCGGTIPPVWVKKGEIMGIKLKSKQAEAVETKQISESGQPLSEEVETKKVDLPDTLTQGAAGCEVGVDMSFTENLGNYRSARVGVSLRITVAHNEIDEAYNYAKLWVDNRMETLVSEVQDMKSA